MWILVEIQNCQTFVKSPMLMLLMFWHWFFLLRHEFVNIIVKQKYVNSKLVLVAPLGW